MKLRIVITGANGMLGRELSLMNTAQAEIIPLDRESLDITNASLCMQQFERIRPDAVIHCAAYTAVDQAESEVEEAFRINGEGTRNVAAAATAIGAKLCYISTDYVFDGNSKSPYKPSDTPSPATVYGKSKLAGEQHIQELMERFFIVRTSWVFGKYGHNFVETMLRLAQVRNELLVVDDQIGSPTYTYDLARLLLELVLSEKYGIYHASNSGSCSWHAFARAIFRLSGQTMTVNPCTTAEFPRPAPRPAYSVMDCSAISERGFEGLRSWEQALEHYFEVKN